VRAEVCRELGPIAGLAVEELPSPAPGPREVVIRSEARREAGN
jgi:NADPH:quinone reductase-like Zn-dependent oxidoreductase